MKIEILTTPGCSNCSVVEKIFDDLEIPYDVIDVTKKPEYLQKYPIYTAPGVVIDGKLEFIGIPKKQKLIEKIEDVKKSS
jgi:glutaredoxin